MVDIEDNGPRPALWSGRHFTSKVSARVQIPIASFEAWFRAVPLEKILPAHGIVAATVGSRAITGTWNDPGARRRVLQADGSSAIEEVLTRDPSGSFTYMVWGFRQPMGLLVRYGRGAFTFAPAGPNATDITWEYHFAPSSPLAVPLLALMIRAAFRPFMQASIAAIRDVAEREVALR